MTKRVIDLRTDEEKVKDLEYRSLMEVETSDDDNVCECCECSYPSVGIESCPLKYGQNHTCWCCVDCRNFCAMELRMQRRYRDEVTDGS